MNAELHEATGQKEGVDHGSTVSTPPGPRFSSIPCGPSKVTQQTTSVLFSRVDKENFESKWLGAHEKADNRCALPLKKGGRSELPMPKVHAGTSTKPSGRPTNQATPRQTRTSSPVIWWLSAANCVLVGWAPVLPLQGEGKETTQSTKAKPNLPLPPLLCTGGLPGNKGHLQPPNA